MRIKRFETIHSNNIINNNNEISRYYNMKCIQKQSTPRDRKPRTPSATPIKKTQSLAVDFRQKTDDLSSNKNHNSHQNALTE